MQFNSLIFLFFVTMFFILWPQLRRGNMSRWLTLVIASFIFYGWWDWRFLFLIIASGLIDYGAGLGMTKYPSRKKLLLTLSILGNVGSLAVFKYLDFSINNLNWILSHFHLEMSIPAAKLILPVGISFYTFQSMSYTIDIYRGQLQPTRNIFHFFSYLALFPQLVAGPIVRARDLLPQLKSYRKNTPEQNWDGLKLIVNGFFKKVVIADTLAPEVNEAFASVALPDSMLYWWLITAMFSYQIYCDFSGYSDIARGLGKWLGYEFPLNFKNPYIASSFRDFWQRWHISLSTWFRDYVYFPLGGGKKGSLLSHRNLWITMLLSGLWHGANWTFVAWGGLHALYLSLERLTDWPARLKKIPLGKHITTLLIFIMTMVAWVFFRADNFTEALAILSIMFDFTAWDMKIIDQLIDNNATNVLWIIICSQLFFHFNLEKRNWDIDRSRVKTLIEISTYALLIMACIYMRGPSGKFIYFQF